MVALPLVIWVAVFGYTRFDAVNAVLAILGFYSLCVVVFNLIPKAPLDGASAWQVIPLFIQRVRERRKKRSTKRSDWRSY